MNRWFYFLFISCAVFFSACKTGKDQPDTTSIYFDYKLSAEEGNDNLTILLQFREDGYDGDAVSIAGPGSVRFDGEVLTADSTKMSGSFYEIHKPINGFAGKHTILFTGTDKKEYREEFNFQPVILVTTIADTVQRGDLDFEFEGLENEALVRVLITDTSFINDGINEVDTIKAGRLTIPGDKLDKLANGPVQLVFIRENSRRVENGTDMGGRLLITYTLKREFHLADQAETKPGGPLQDDLHK